MLLTLILVSRQVILSAVQGSCALAHAWPADWRRCPCVGDHMSRSGSKSHHTAAPALQKSLGATRADMDAGVADPASWRMAQTTPRRAHNCWRCTRYRSSFSASR